MFSSINEVWTYLETFPMFQKVGAKAANFKLENITEAAQKLGNPHKNFPSIHVAGTNGKGTTCHLLESVYRNAGYKTGLFTSPHLLRYNERVRVNGGEIEDSELISFFNLVKSELKEISLTYFELSTLLAFWYFSKEKVDIAVIETGLGGRLDSTNIISPELSIITSIGLDHQDILGKTEVEISREKAGIIKSNRPVILGNISNECLIEINKKAESVLSMVYEVKDLKPLYSRGLVSIEKINYKVQTQFLESVNKWNVAMVWQAVEVLKFKFPVSKEVLITTFSGFEGVAGRFEKLHINLDWYFCGAHNVQAFNSVLETMSSFGDKNKTLFLSMMKDKINPELMALIENEYDKIYFYEQEGERAAKKEDIEKYFKVFEVNQNNSEFILRDLKTELVIFAGSFYFYGIVKRWLSKSIN